MRFLTHLILCGSLLSCTSSSDKAFREAFLNPDNSRKPMPFLHVNGRMTTGGIETLLTDAQRLSGYGGIAVLPVSEGMRWGGTTMSPGTEPAYLSDEYFDRYGDILSISARLGMEVVLYDDIDFPSGSAGGKLQREYPAYTRKYLLKEETFFKGPGRVQLERADTSLLLMAVSAMDTTTRQVVGLAPFMHGNRLDWDAPEGHWRVMFFNCKFNINSLVDYMQPEAADKVIEMTYGEYGKRFAQYFGNVITRTFYDDVGFVHQEETWTPAITDLFRRKYGRDPALYYPAMYYDIGEETQPARVAFYDIRSELMAEGYVRKVAEWNAANGLRSMGHPPENYSPNTIVAHGDILKYYRHTQIPLMDAIFFYGRGLHGFKQISSAADLGDKPDVGAEIYGAFPDSVIDMRMLYRTVMEMMVRGVTLVVPHGMWYTPETEKIRIPPLISHHNPALDDLPQYSAYVGRVSTLLHGGVHVSDVALLWPITAIQAESYIDRDKTSGLPTANWLPPHVCHHVLSDLLTNELRRDFTFVHPEDLHSGKITAEGRELKLNNTYNIQRYKVLIIPGGEVISAETLHAIKRYYDGGGRIMAVEALPTRSSEFGRDAEVQSLVRDMFGASGVYADDISATNGQGGQAVYIPRADKESLRRAFDLLGLQPDVAFDESRIPVAETFSSPRHPADPVVYRMGYVNYLHKQKEGKEIYYFTNSTDHRLATTVRLRGAIRPERWDPYTGTIEPLTEYERLEVGGVHYTQFELDLDEVSSVFIVGNH
ncbi:MAG: hypothetical protein LBT83_09150 [Tannerella sp.]|jgi:hypothetical protein|nr:hypothetical protein [Tannerella sp.]